MRCKITNPEWGKRRRKGIQLNCDPASFESSWIVPIWQAHTTLHMTTLFPSLFILAISKINRNSSTRSVLESYGLWKEYFMISVPLLLSVTSRRIDKVCSYWIVWMARHSHTHSCLLRQRPPRVKAPQCIKSSRDTATRPNYRVRVYTRYWTDVVQSAHGPIRPIFHEHWPMRLYFLQLDYYLHFGTRQLSLR